MTAPTLTLLGPPRLLGADGAPVRLRTRKELALLAYLAAEGTRPHPRETLLGLLWPDVAEDSARLSLRVALAHLRAALGDGAALAADRHTVQLLPCDERWLDVAAFAALLTACRAHRHPPDAPCAACVERLTRASALYRGEFLDALALPDAAPFEDWALLRREELRRQMLDALATLAMFHEQSGDTTALGRAARRQLELEPWHEPAHRQLMRGLALAGDRSAALTQYDTCRRVLAEELGVEPDVETHALYERIRAGDLPSVARAAAPRHNLPAPLTPLVGREADLAALTALVRQDEVRLLTLVGAGGMGKTRLALELARHGLDAYADGVYVVALASLAAVEGLAATIAAALDLAVPGDDPAAALPRLLRDKQLLLILDNCEHLLAGVGLVVEILQAAPRVRIIATSRERLHVRGEHLYVVEGLAYATDATVAAATTTPAMRLFVQSARRVQASFSPSAAEMDAVVRICALVQGMPLALELAAAWSAVLAPAEIAAEIVRSADVLATDWPDAPERQRSMRAVFAWSWALLSEAEQQMLRQLAVFRGGFTRRAAERVTGATLGALTALVHKSLLRRTEAAVSGATEVGRYEMHELLRQFVAEHLDATPAERDTVQAQHSAFYLEFVAARARRLARDEPRAAAAEIRADLDNIREVWTWAADHARVAALEQAAFGWWQFCLLQGLESESRRMFAHAVRRLRRTLEQLGPAHPAHRPYARGLSLLLALHANQLFGQGSYARMAAQAREAMRLGAASEGAEGETFGAYVLGRACQELGQRRDARMMWERTIALARTFQARPACGEIVYEAEWLAHIWLVGVALLDGDYAGGRARVLVALRLCRSLGKRRGELVCLSDLAMIEYYTGDDRAARQRYEEVLSRTQAVGDRRGAVRVQRVLGEVLRVQGQYGPARHMLVAAVTAAQEIGFGYEEIWAVAALVRLHCQLGDAAGAQQWHDQLLTLRGRRGVTPDSQAAGFRAGALYALHTGDHQRALAEAQHGLGLTEQYDIPTFRAEAAVILGHVQVALTQPEAAARAYQQAVSWYALSGNTPLAREPQAALAQLALTHGDRGGACARVEALLPGLGEPPRAGVQPAFYTDLICYRVLEAAHDRRAAGVLHTTLQRVHACADRIDDDALRRSFLAQVSRDRARHAGRDATASAGAPTAG